MIFRVFREQFLQNFYIGSLNRINNRTKFYFHEIRKFFYDRRQKKYYLRSISEQFNLSERIEIFSCDFFYLDLYKLNRCLAQSKVSNLSITRMLRKKQCGRGEQTSSTCLRCRGIKRKNKLPTSYIVEN